jgi:hypothetical protein
MGGSAVESEMDEVYTYSSKKLATYVIRRQECAENCAINNQYKIGEHKV